MFRDPQKSSVTFCLRPTHDLRNPRDAFRFQRKLEQRKAPAKELHSLGAGPLEPEIVSTVPRDPSDDDHFSELRDDWRAEEREWMDDFRERCRDL